MSDHIISDDQLWKAIGSAAKGAAALIIATGVLWGAIWWALQPRIDQYFDDKLAELRVEFGSMTMQLTRIENALPAPRGFVEFSGGGKIVGNMVYQPGEVVTFLYQLRRNKSCSTTVRAQFWSAKSNGVVNEYTYDTSAIQAPTSLSYTLFSVRIRLPSDMVDGHYSYTPILLPDTRSCPTEDIIHVPPSDFFTVEAEAE